MFAIGSSMEKKEEFLDDRFSIFVCHYIDHFALDIHSFQTDQRHRDVQKDGGPVVIWRA